MDLPTESPIERTTFPPAERTLELCAQQRREWESGRKTPVEKLLARHPELCDDRDAVLDLIYNEVLLRDEFAAPPDGCGAANSSPAAPADAGEFRDRFPEYADDVRRLFEVHAAIESHAATLERVTPRSNRTGDTARSQAGAWERGPGPSPRDDQREGQWVGEYEILEELGRGGMGIVYKARQPGTNRLVALKVVLAGRFASTEELKRFRAEAEAAARLDHPGIVPVYEVGQHGDLCYFSMAFVDGRTLADLFRSGALPPAEAAHLVCRVAEAVEYAHSRGVIHRDLKPQNILVRVESGESRVESEEQKPSATGRALNSQLSTLNPRITDFGLAKQADIADSLTITGQVLGTPHYMAPEQAEGKHDRVTPATDVYALGAILYEALTGRPPFEAATAVDVLWLVVNQEAPSPRVRNRNVDPDLETICVKCLEKDPQRRYRTAADLAADLQRYLAGRPISARPVTRLNRCWRWCRRRPLIAAMAATIVALLIALAAGSSIAALRLAEEQQETLANLHRAKDAERVSRKRLFDSYLNQARFGRRTGRPGQRLETLALIANAVELSSQLDLPSESVLALRNEAVAALSLIDVQPTRRGPPLAMRDSAVAFDNTLQRFAVSDTPGGLSIYRSETRQRVARLPLNGNPARSLKFGPDGTRLAALRDSHVFVWRLESGNRAPQLLAARVAAFDFTPDGGQLVTISREGWLGIWDLKSHRRTSRFTMGNPARPVGCSVHPTGRQVAVWTGPDVAVVDLRNGKTMARFTHHSECTVKSLAWSADGRLLATGTADHSAYVWDTNNLSGPRFKLTGHDAWVRHVAFSGDGNLLMTASPADEQTRIWNPWTGRLLIRFDGCGLRLGGDGRRIGGIDRMNVAGWSVARNRVVRSFRSRDLTYMAAHVDISSDGRLLASGNWDGLRLWDFATGAELQFVERRPVDGLVFAPDSKSLVTSDASGLWSWPIHSNDGATRLGQPKPMRSGAGVRCAKALRFTRDGRKLFALNDDEGIARILSLGSVDRAPRLISDEGLNRGTISPDGRWIVGAAGNAGGLTIWNVAGEKIRRLLTREPNVACSFSPDGKWLVGGGSREYFFWRVGSWKLSHTLKLPEALATNRRLTLSRTGHLLAVSHDRQSIHLIDPHRGRVVWKLPIGHYNTWLCFGPDGGQLACMDARMGIQVWDLKALARQLSLLGLDPAISSNGGDGP